LGHRHTGKIQFSELLTPNFISELRKFKMQFVRTPDDRFKNLPDYPFKSNYLEVDDFEGGKLRIHYVDEGPGTAAPVVLFHGEPTRSFLYRQMIPGLVKAGYRVLVTKNGVGLKYFLSIY
jgi:hypothetical protein